MARTGDAAAVHVCQCDGCQKDRVSVTSDLHRALNRLLAATDERTRRLIVGYLALQRAMASRPRPGTSYLHRVTGLSPHTIRRGMKELSRGSLQLGRVRKPGGGRKRAARPAEDED